MLKVAIIETEAVAKNIIFELGKLFIEYDWTFHYYTSIVEFAKADSHHHYELLIFHEKFNTERIYQSFMEKKNRLVIFLVEDKKNLDSSIFSRVLFMNRHNIKQEVQDHTNIITLWVKEKQEYYFSYNGVNLALQVQGIHYIEKQNKNLIFHTDKGELFERGNMSDISKQFEPLGFLRIHSSYLVNFTKILKIEADIMTLTDGTTLPISRSRKKEVKAYFKKFI